MPSLEVPAEAGDVAVADPFGNAGDGKARGDEELGGFFEAQFQVERMKGSCFK